MTGLSNLYSYPGEYSIGIRIRFLFTTSRMKPSQHEIQCFSLFILHTGKESKGEQVKQGMEATPEQKRGVGDKTT